MLLVPRALQWPTVGAAGDRKTRRSEMRRQRFEGGMPPGSPGRALPESWRRGLVSPSLPQEVAGHSEAPTLKPGSGRPIY